MQRALQRVGPRERNQASCCSLTVVDVVEDIISLIYHGINGPIPPALVGVVPQLRIMGDSLWLRLGHAQLLSLYPAHYQERGQWGVLVCVQIWGKLPRHQHHCHGQRYSK